MYSLNKYAFITVNYQKIPLTVTLLYSCTFIGFITHNDKWYQILILTFTRGHHHVPIQSQSSLQQRGKRQLRLCRPCSAWGPWFVGSNVFTLKYIFSAKHRPDLAYYRLYIIGNTNQFRCHCEFNRELSRGFGQERSHGLTICKINCDLGRKSHILQPLCTATVLLKGFSLAVGYEKLEWCP